MTAADAARAGGPQAALATLASACAAASPREVPALAVQVIGIGLLGPGLVDWARGSALLRDPCAWQHQPTVVPPPQRLPATERRRAGAVVKASVVVADQVLGGLPAASGIDPTQLATVFTSSTGDPLNCHLLCEALAAPERLMSPTRFTNSVHNAAAGYWHIATQSRAPSTSLAAFDASFSAGLLEAAVQCQSSGQAVLLVACDVPYPEPLHAVRPVLDVFAVALLLAPANWASPVPGWTGRTLVLQAADEQTPTCCGHAGLDRLVDGIPAARALPLLMALAQPGAQHVVLEDLGGQVLPFAQSALDEDADPARQTLDAAAIAARIPHSGAMALLHSLQDWSAEHIHCTARSHLDPLNPLRGPSGMDSVAAIEYASQAMALHGSLNAAPGTAPVAGFLASVRSVHLAVDRLDTVVGALHVHAHKLAGDTRQAMYQFKLEDESGRVLVQGRATVVLNVPPVS